MVLLTVVLVPDRAARRRGTTPTTTTGRSAAFFAWALALEALSLAVFAATDVFLFYVVFEATLIPAYFLIGGFGRARPRRAAAEVPDVPARPAAWCCSASVIGLYVVSADSRAPRRTCSRDLAALDIATNAGRWLFARLLHRLRGQGAAVPAAHLAGRHHREGHPGTSVLLVCILDKIGTFGMLRFCLGMFPEASDWATPVVVVLALVSIVYGALRGHRPGRRAAPDRPDLAVSHFGFIVLGIFVFTSQGASGAILYMVNHGIATAALFLLAGFLIRARGTTLISRMGGMEKVTPVAGRAVPGRRAGHRRACRA